MARLRNPDGTFVKGHNSLPETINMHSKRPKIKRGEARNLRHIGRLIHQEYPHVSALEGAFMAQIAFSAVAEALLNQAAKTQHRRAFYVPGFGTFHVRCIPPVRRNVIRRGTQDLPARYRLQWRPTPALKEAVKRLPVLPGPDGQIRWAHFTKLRKKQRVRKG